MGLLLLTSAREERSSREAQEGANDRQRSPKGVLLLLFGHFVNGLLPTVISRCQPAPFLQHKPSENTHASMLDWQVLIACWTADTAFSQSLENARLEVHERQPIRGYRSQEAAALTYQLRNVWPYPEPADHHEAAPVPHTSLNDRP